MKPLRLQRVSEKPLLTPRQEVPWERDAVLNTAAIYTDDRVHLFYRGVAHPGWQLGNDAPYLSSIGHAVSEDGLSFECDSEPVLSPSMEKDGSMIHNPEDPRVAKIADTFYMTYCDYDGVIVQICLASSKDLRQWRNHGPVIPYARFGMNKNAALFPEKIQGKYGMIHRPEPPQCRRSEAAFDWDIWSRDAAYPGGMRLAFSEDLVHWTYEETVLMGPRAEHWDNLKVGIAGPPIKIPQGWLVVYHGVDKSKTYRLGVALLDLKDPAKVLFRQAEPILEPELEWERCGDVPNVVFSCGGFLRGEKLWVYYGGADTDIGAACADISVLL